MIPSIFITAAILILAVVIHKGANRLANTIADLQAAFGGLTTELGVIGPELGQLGDDINQAVAKLATPGLTQEQIDSAVAAVNTATATLTTHSATITAASKTLEAALNPPPA
jgi:methyl-accepting chemotaxis protein